MDDDILLTALLQQESDYEKRRKAGNRWEVIVHNVIFPRDRWPIPCKIDIGIDSGLNIGCGSSIMPAKIVIVFPYL